MVPLRSNDLRCERVDLIIMDCEMPGMSGYEVTQNIRRTEDAMSRLQSLLRHTPPWAAKRALMQVWTTILRNRFAGRSPTCAREMATELVRSV